jgi:hypothetical protein|tara:strand:- start:73 stop:210 length:138 start_codon:yes stop_codon:yes gene_type:complete
MGRALLLLAVFAAGYFWGDLALSLATDVWQDLAEVARPKFEELFK